VKCAWSSSTAQLIVDVPLNPIEVRTPRTSLKQVISDLLDNAKQACPTGIIRISARSDERTGLMELHIEDEGPGVPQMIRNHLGEPFFTTRDGGNGLGLFNAVTFAKAMGGILQISDRLEGGAKITLQIPLIQPDHV
jgi:signal transduction histidine kinase